MTTLGAVFLPHFAPERLRGAASAAEGAGLEELWLWEDVFWHGGVSTAASVLSWTTALRVAIGIFPMPLRNVATTAMEIATLDRLFPGRLIPGVGAGVLDWMGQIGARADSPLTLLKEYVPALRSLLHGDEVTTHGRYVNLDRVSLTWAPAKPPPVLVGTGGPKSLRVSGAVSDGTILASETTPDMVREARSLIDEGRTAAGRSDHHPIAVYLLTATGRDARERLERASHSSGRHAARDSGVAGDADAVAEAVQRWADAGADTVVLQPTPDEPDIEGFMEFVAGDVRQRVTR